MEIHVVSHRHSPDRRACIAARLQEQGLPHVFFDAIDGQDGRRFFPAIDAERFLTNTGHEATPGEIGRYASHLSLWQLCAERREPLVVMEDDALLRPNFVSALLETDKLIARFGFIRLEFEESDRNCGKVEVGASGEFTLYYSSRCPFGATCYAIAPRVAAQFVAASRVLAGPVDLFIKRFWVHGQPIFALYPCAVAGSVESDRSTIEVRDKRRPTLTLRARRTLSKIRDASERLRFNRQMQARLAEM